MTDMETRLALLENEVKAHMVAEEKFWAEMKKSIESLDARIDELNNTKNKWMGFGLGALFIGSAVYSVLRWVVGR